MVPTRPGDAVKNNPSREVTPPAGGMEEAARHPTLGPEDLDLLLFYPRRTGFPCPSEAEGPGESLGHPAKLALFPIPLPAATLASVSAPAYR